MNSVSLKSALLLIFFAVGCATTNKSSLRTAFNEDALEYQESVKSGSPAQAINELSMFLEMDAKNDEARYLRALAYQKLKEYESAAQDYEILLTHNGANEKAHYNLAMIYAFKLKKAEEALKHFDQFISLNLENPKNPAIAKIMLSLDKNKEDRGRLSALIGGIIADRGIMRAAMEEDSAKKRASLLKALKKNPTSAEINFAMAEFSEYEGKTENAIKYYEKAVELKPTFAKCHYNLGQLLLKNQKEGGQVHLIKARLFGWES